MQTVKTLDIEIVVCEEGGRILDTVKVHLYSNDPDSAFLQRCEDTFKMWVEDNRGLIGDGEDAMPIYWGVESDVAKFLLYRSRDALIREEKEEFEQNAREEEVTVGGF